MKNIKRALISVSDKTGIVELAQFLSQKDIEIISTGGTAKLLVENNIPLIEISDYTEFPEMMDGRLKTLHPKVHGGLLGRRDKDIDIMNQYDIPEIDLVVVNLYPFAQTIANPDCDFATAIENIDIGGPTMLRAAAKNHKDVTVICQPSYYQAIMDEMNTYNNAISAKTRFELARATFEHCANYDGTIANYLGTICTDTLEKTLFFPNTINFQFNKKQDMRYGENPHQKAALYIEKDYDYPSVAHAQQLHGKSLSYNNIADSDAALECVLELKQPSCVIVKHANPCGVSSASTLIDAYNNAYACDSTSAFGGIIAFNAPLDCVTANKIIEQQFVEVIIAPAIDNDALKVISKKKNIRLLRYNHKNDINEQKQEFKKVAGGLLVQDKDQFDIKEKDLQIVSKKIPTKDEITDMLFAWKIVKHVKSNAIVFAKDNMTIGIGAGQMSRVFSSKIAADKAKEAKLSLYGSVLASDAFFPFRDGIDMAAAYGISCIIQPGGSIKDQEIIEAANEHNIAMVFTKVRHFKH